MAAGGADRDSSSETQVRDAACIVLADMSRGEPRFLLGRRRATQVFLPNKWVFPGGRVDDDDRALAAALHAPAAGQLAFALAAIRELYEEAGVVLGDRSAAPSPPLPASWQAFARHAPMPAYRQMTPLARAITPPGRPRRFDTWFFLADYAQATATSLATDGELLDLDWFTLAGARGLDLPLITRFIVDDVASLMSPAPEVKSRLIPFYFQDIGGYRRTLIDPSEAPLQP